MYLLAVLGGNLPYRVESPCSGLAEIGLISIGSWGYDTARTADPKLAKGVFDMFSYKRGAGREASLAARERGGWSRTLSVTLDQVVSGVSCCPGLGGRFQCGLWSGIHLLLQRR